MPQTLQISFQNCNVFNELNIEFIYMILTILHLSSNKYVNIFNRISIIPIIKRRTFKIEAMGDSMRIAEKIINNYLHTIGYGELI